MTVTGDAPATSRPRFGIATPGLATVQPPAGADTPSPTPRSRRRLALRILAVMATVAVGVTIGWFAAPAGGSRVLVLTHAVPAGGVVTTADVQVMTMASAPAGHVSSLASLRGAVARSSLQPGQVVTNSVLTPAGSVPGHGLVTVGIAVTAGHGPAQPLVVGDTVAVIDVPQNSGNTSPPPHLLVPSASVTAVTTTRDGTENVSITVPIASAVSVAASAAQGEATLVLLS